MIARQLTANPPEDPVSGSAISADGEHLAYSDLTDGVSVLKIDTGEVRSFPKAKFFTVSAWLDQGSVLLTGDGPGLWKMSRFDGKIERVRNDWGIVVPSRDGKRTAIHADGVWIGTPGGPERLIVSDESTWNFAHFAWSPSGRRLAYVKWRQKRGWRATAEDSLEGKIETCDINGEHRTTVLTDKNLHGEIDFSDVEWLADGRLVYGLDGAVAREQQGRQFMEPARRCRFRSADRQSGAVDRLDRIFDLSVQQFVRWQTPCPQKVSRRESSEDRPVQFERAVGPRQTVELRNLA